MKLSKFKESSDYFTGKASEIARQLAFAGIAVVWIFKQSDKNIMRIPHELISPILLFAIALALDLMHYVYGGIAWSVFHRYYEKKKRVKTHDPNLRASPYINWPTWFFFISKISLVMFGYFLLSKFLVGIMIE